jgi:hypothetical protein
VKRGRWFKGSHCLRRRCQARSTSSWTARRTELAWVRSRLAPNRARSSVSASPTREACQPRDRSPAVVEPGPASRRHSRTSGPCGLVVEQDPSASAASIHLVEPGRAGSCRRTNCWQSFYNIPGGPPEPLSQFRPSASRKREGGPAARQERVVPSRWASGSRAPRASSRAVWRGTLLHVRGSASAPIGIHGTEWIMYTNRSIDQCLYV